MELIVAKRFRLHHCVGSGSFGELYIGNDVQDNNQVVALKLEPTNTKYPQLQHEYTIYRALQGGTNIARLIWYGNEALQNIMAIQRLGRSLDSLFNYRLEQFSLKTVLMLTDQIFNSIEYMHKKGYIHRDIKPENFMMGADQDNENVLYIIDFGLSVRYLTSKTDPLHVPSQSISNQNELFPKSEQLLHHIQFSKNSKFVGTAKYQSVNGHKGMTLSRRDDMESIGYMLVYFLKGSLPWDSIRSRRNNNNVKLFHEQIKELKSKTTAEKLCSGLPIEFTNYINSARSLRFDEEPPYSQYRKMFRDLYLSLGYTYDYQYDWTGEDYAKPVGYTANSKSSTKKKNKNNIKKGKEIPRPIKDFCRGNNLVANPHLRNVLHHNLRRFGSNSSINIINSTAKEAGSNLKHEVDKPIPQIIPYLSEDFDPANPMSNDTSDAFSLYNKDHKQMMPLQRKASKPFLHTSEVDPLISALSANQNSKISSVDVDFDNNNEIVLSQPKKDDSEVENDDPFQFEGEKADLKTDESDELDDNSCHLNHSQSIDALYMPNNHHEPPKKKKVEQEKIQPLKRIVIATNQKQKPATNKIKPSNSTLSKKLNRIRQSNIPGFNDEVLGLSTWQRQNYDRNRTKNLRKK